jgi:hypothetical protein
MNKLQFIVLSILVATIFSDVVNLDEGWYYIKNAASGKYIQVANSEAKANANVEIGTGTGKKNQKWKLTKLSNGYISLISGLGDFSLDIERAKNEKGTNVIIYNTHLGEAQQLKLLSSNNGNAVYIATKISSDSKVVCVYNDLAADGTNIHIWDNYFTKQQTWFFEKCGAPGSNQENNQGNNQQTQTNTNAQKSYGCGKDIRLPKTGSFDFFWTKGKRNVKIDIPDNYNKNNAYKLVIGMHCMGGWAGGVRDEGYYGLKPLDTGKTTIFVAPEGNGGYVPWDQNDYTLFDELLYYLKNELCIDTTRVFVAGFSYGSMITTGLSWSRQSTIRAVAVYETAERNIWLPQHTGKSIGWMGVLGYDDTVCTPEMGRNARNIILKYNSENGKAVNEQAEEAPRGGAHKCYDYKTVYPQYPTRWCTQSGGHIWNHKDPGQYESWVPKTTWEFFNKF